MRRTFIATVAALGFGLSLFAVAPSVRAEEKEKEMKGVLIDQHCAKGKTEETAAGHGKDCCLKCAEHGFSLISGKTEYKFDDDSAKKAKEYLEKHDSTKVTVKATEKDKKLSVTSIEETK